MPNAKTVMLKVKLGVSQSKKGGLLFSKMCQAKLVQFNF